MYKSSIHIQLEHNTSPRTIESVAQQVAVIADALEKIYQKAKRLNFVVVVSDRMQDTVIIVQDCVLCAVAFPALSDNALLAVQSVNGDHAFAECVMAQCFIKINPVGLVRVLDSLSDTIVKARPFNSTEIASRVCKLLEQERAARGN